MRSVTLKLDLQLLREFHLLCQRSRGGWGTKKRRPNNQHSGQYCGRGGFKTLLHVDLEVPFAFGCVTIDEFFKNM